MRFGRRTWTVVAAVVSALGLVCLFEAVAVGRDAGGVAPGLVDRPQSQLSALGGKGANDPLPWPTLYGVHQTGRVNASFDCFGTIGMSPFPVYVTPYPQWPLVNLESPPGSTDEYLFAGSIWVGGIVGTDTLVSTGFSGWESQREMYPTGYSADTPEGTITRFDYPTRQSMRAEFDDTVHAGIEYADDFSGRAYEPLGIQVISQSHSYAGPLTGDCIVYDVFVRNIGQQHIRKGYFGVYLDADISCVKKNLWGSVDDMVGSIRDRGIAYAVDNNGDPVGTRYDSVTSPTKAIGLKFLYTSFAAHDTSFNWWVSSSDTARDFGPRQKAHDRDFGTGGLGTPEGDGNKYFMMSMPEWDYNQVMTGAIGENDPIWLTPLAKADSMRYGADSRMLLSIGPFELEPDSAVRVQFAVFITDSVHTDPRILDFVNLAPELYTATLRLANVVRNASVADSLGASLRDPSLPPTGLRQIQLSTDSVTISWDPWVTSGGEGYDIYLSPIPDSAFVHPGVIPPWYHPTSPVLNTHVSESRTKYTIRSLMPGKAYACNIAHRAAGSPGTASMPLLFRTPLSQTEVRLTDTLLFLPDGDDLVLQWDSLPTSSQIEHFNVYRFADTAEAHGAFEPYYSDQRLSITPADSTTVDGGKYFYYAMSPLARVSGSQEEYRDTAAVDGNAYIVTAVDSAGFESSLSRAAVVHRVAPRDKDILVLTHSGGRINFVTIDSLKAFYNTVLQGYDFDIYSVVDTQSRAGCDSWAEDCVDWRSFMPYRLLIVDDGLKDALFSSEFENRTGGFAKYLHSGGEIAYFGSFGAVGGYPFNPLTEPNWFAMSDPLATAHFGVDSVFYAGMYYYKDHSSAPYIDSVFGFSRAEAVSFGMPSLVYDTTRYAFSSGLQAYWPKNTPPSVSTFRINDKGVATHVYRSRRPLRSINEGQVVGVHTTLARGATYLFGFHLWYMEKNSAHQLVDWMMSQVSSANPGSKGSTLPDRAILSQNYPNPFNPSTTIPYYLTDRSTVRVEIYNIVGQRVCALVDGTEDAGYHTIRWNGRDDGGRQLSSGVYLCRLQTDKVVSTTKMVLLK